MRPICALAVLVLAGCGWFAESSFSLAPESRIPKWLSLPPGQTRANVAVTMDYYIDSFGRTATFILRDSNGHTAAKVSGLLLEPEPLKRKNKKPGYPEGYPSYEVITVGGVTEIIEHRQMEPVFYVTDDPEVLAEFLHHDSQKTPLNSTLSDSPKAI